VKNCPSHWAGVDFWSGAKFEIARVLGLKAGKLAISFLRVPRIAGRDSVVASEGTMRPKERRDSGQADLLRSRLAASRIIEIHNLSK